MCKFIPLQFQICYLRSERNMSLQGYLEITSL